MIEELPPNLGEQVAEIAADRSHGASELARRALQIVVTAAREETVEDAGAMRNLLHCLADALIAARPSMAPVYNLMARWREELVQIDEPDLAQIRQQAANSAERIVRQSEQAVAAIGERGAQLVKPGQTIITHSFSSTVLAILEKQRQQQIRVIASESRPLCEGYKLAEQLSAWAIPTTLITDAQLGLFVPEADVALVGADSLLVDGSVVNKAGTYLLALAAQAHDVPFYVCCESFKQRSEDMPPLELETLDPAELGAPGYPYVTVKNIYFEITPAHLITNWIHEQSGT